MLIQEQVRQATLPVANLTAGGMIWTAITTVDISSSFNITQTTAGQTLSLPNPTDASAWLQANVANIGTASFIIHWETAAPNEVLHFVRNGTAWRYAWDTRNGGIRLSPVNFVVGANALTHNFKLPTGTFSNVMLQIFDSVGNNITSGRRVFALDTANITVVNFTVAVANCTVFIIPLA